jgi:hypothetical protein
MVARSPPSNLVRRAKSDDRAACLPKPTIGQPPAAEFNLAGQVWVALLVVPRVLDLAEQQRRIVDAEIHTVAIALLRVAGSGSGEARVAEIRKDCPGVPSGAIRQSITRGMGCVCNSYLEIRAKDEAQKGAAASEARRSLAGQVGHGICDFARTMASLAGRRKPSALRSE